MVLIESKRHVQQFIIIYFIYLSIDCTQVNLSLIEIANVAADAVISSIKIYLLSRVETCTCVHDNNIIIIIIFIAI